MGLGSVTVVLLCGPGHREPPYIKSLLNPRANLKNLARTCNFTGAPKSLKILTNKNNNDKRGGFFFALHPNDALGRFIRGCRASQSGNPSKTQTSGGLTMNVALAAQPREVMKSGKYERKLDYFDDREYVVEHSWKKHPEGLQLN